MPWNCFLVKSIRRELGALVVTLPDGREVGYDEIPVGAMWHTNADPRENREGPSLVVRLPGGRVWYMNHEGTDGARWTVTGEPPNVTASPSINMVGTYHGFVRGGVVSDDVDGRKFDEDGTAIV